MKFEVGEIAIMSNVGNKYHIYNGSECEIIGDECYRTGKEYNGVQYLVKMCCDGFVLNCPATKLRKKRPPEETTTWDKCVWRPREYA